MSSSAKYTGHIEIDPPLNSAEIEYLRKFTSIRHCARMSGPYNVDIIEDENGNEVQFIKFLNGMDLKEFGMENVYPDQVNNSIVQPGKPGFWCHLEISDDGTRIYWDKSEKSSCLHTWVAYIYAHFLSPLCLAKRLVPQQFAEFTADHEIVYYDLQVTGYDI